MEDKKISKEELIERVKWFGEKPFNYILSGFIIEKLVEFTARDNKSMTDLITEMTLLYRDKELNEKKLELSNKKIEVLEKLNDKNKVDINFYQNKISRLSEEIATCKSEITTLKIELSKKIDNPFNKECDEECEFLDLDTILKDSQYGNRKHRNIDERILKDGTINYCVNLKHNGKKYKGIFKTLEEAVKFRDDSKKEITK